MATIDWGDFEQTVPKPRTRIHAVGRIPSQGDDYNDDDFDDGFDEEEELEEQMFELVEMDLPVSDTHIRHFTVCNEVQILVTADKRVCVIDAGRSKFYTYEIASKPDDDIRKSFLCPAGVHCLLSTTNGENFYINCKEDPSSKSATVKAKRCDKLRGIEVESVGWNKYNQTNADYEKNSGAILLGTSNGQLFETRLEKDAGAKQYKVVYDFKEKANDSQAITGLEVERFPGTQSGKLLVVATTICRIYQFIGGPSFEMLFEDDMYKKSPSFQELPANNLHSELHFWHQDLRPKTFAWITGVGIMHGRLAFQRKAPAPPRPPTDAAEPESVLKDSCIIPCFDSQPVGLAISEFHFYVLYDDRMVILGHPPGLGWTSGSPPFDKLKPQDIENRVEFKYKFGGSQKGLGLTRDPATGMLYAYTPSHIFELVVNNEEKNVWAQFLERAKDPNEREREAYFKRALRSCQGDEEKRDIVLQAQAAYHFGSGQYDLAARLYSRTRCPVEDTALKFWDVGQSDALLQYVLCRLEFMQQRRGDDRQQESTQLTCLTTWAVQMYLDKLNRVQEDETVSHVAKSNKLREVYKKFEAFLRDHKDFLDKSTTHSLIAGHGQVAEEQFFCELTDDWERVITFHITQTQDCAAAVDVLTRRCTEAKHEPLWYQFSPTLMQHHPDRLVQGWMTEPPARFLNPSKLVPALVKYDPRLHNPPAVTENQVIVYLQWVIAKRRSADPVMHNLLLSLYARQPDGAVLLQFLQGSQHYDKKYALRLCIDAGKTLACVHIYSQMEMYEDAVATALKVPDLALAKANAEKPVDDPQLKKRLWLEIAKYVMQGQSNMKEAIDLLKETQSIKLEDILPFFPDFVLIQDFKQEIIQSLEDYNHEIRQLNAEMEEATRNADAIRASIQELRHRYGYVTSTQPCELCGSPALGRDFYLFPSCRHVFHQDCMLQLLKGGLPAPALRRLQELERVLAEYERAGPPAEEEGDVRYELARKEFDALVTSECPYCSEFMIRMVDKPFCGDAAQAALWAL